jgi:protocatechuate 3,4-dioxygenase beta subunit
MPACVARPEATEGPYFVDERLERSDIRSDPATGAVKVGLPLALAFRVSRIENGACTPLAGAMVDVWHCDAEGVYSDVRDPRNDTTGQQFLRGYQLTDASGGASFTSIFPGWYQGRAVHIHFKIRTEDNLEFTSQLFFDEDLISQVYARDPYAVRGPADTPNARDGIYDEQLLVAATTDGASASALFDVGLVGA